jgi:hypothetical protein
MTSAESKGQPLTDNKRPSAKSDAEKRQQDEAAQQPGMDPRLVDPDKTPGSGMMPDTGGEAPSG